MARILRLTQKPELKKSDIEVEDIVELLRVLVNLGNKHSFYSKLNIKGNKLNIITDSKVEETIVFKS